MAGESKGDSVPLAVVSKGGGAALAGGIQWRAGPPWQEESNETGGFVAPDFAVGVPMQPAAGGGR